MRMKSIIILLSLLAAIFSPISINISLADNGAYIVTLDVCHASGSSLSLDSHMPVIDEHPCKICPLEFVGFAGMSKQRSELDILSFQLERPPRF